MKNYNDIYDDKEAMSRFLDTIYSKGYDKGYADCIDNNELKGDQLIKEAYQKGLNDAWECVRKIFDAGSYSKDTNAIFGDDFHYGRIGDILKKYSASEAIAKIKEYEEKKKADDEIKVGDEVMVDERRMLVLGIDSGGWKQLWCPSTGLVLDNVITSEMTKTGRHFDIQSLLNQMKEEE